MKTDHTLDRSLAIVLMLFTPACGLIGVEPDEIDVVDTGDEQATTTLSGGETSSGGEEGDSFTGSDSDSDSDSSTDSAGDGDGDQDPTGDGDGDPAGDGDGDWTGSGDGDGDESTGDGDGDTGPEPLPCEDFVIDELGAGANDVAVADGPSYVNEECGSEGPEGIYSFTATVAGLHGFTLTSDEFEGGLYLVDGDFCAPLFFSEYVCDIEGVEVVYDLAVDQTLYVMIDVDVPGAGTVTVTTP